MPDTEFGDSHIEGLREALAWRRGELALEKVRIDPLPAVRIKSIGSPAESPPPSDFPA
jgi:putative transcriptional regulator